MNRAADSRRGFTPKQGQYLAFIHAYTLVNGRPPAEAGHDPILPGHTAERSPHGAQPRKGGADFTQAGHPQKHYRPDRILPLARAASGIHSTGQNHCDGLAHQSSDQPTSGVGRVGLPRGPLRRITRVHRRRRFTRLSRSGRDCPRVAEPALRASGIAFVSGPSCLRPGRSGRM